MHQTRLAQRAGVLLPQPVQDTLVVVVVPARQVDHYLFSLEVILAYRALVLALLDPPVAQQLDLLFREALGDLSDLLTQVE